MSGKPGAVTPTPGPWLIFPHGGGWNIGGKLDGSYFVADVINDNGFPENEANAHLIADVGTTYHLTGKTPSELSAALSRVTEERDALAAEVERLNMLLDHYRSMIA